MKTIIVMLLAALLFIGNAVHSAETSIASVGANRAPMVYGVCDTAAPVSNDGTVAFIAPMPARGDSVENGFHASYLAVNGSGVELCPGYERALAESPLGIYRKTTNVRVAANHDFTLFAVVVEYIKTGSTPVGSDVTVPLTLGTKLVVVDAKGDSQEKVLESDKGSVLANQCHVSFSDDGKLLVAAQYLGLLLFDSPGADLQSFSVLECGFTSGKAVITGDGSKVFFTADKGMERKIIEYDVATGACRDTGLSSSIGINDAQLSVSRDGGVISFRDLLDTLVVALRKDGEWKTKSIVKTQVRQPAVSADGRHVAYQAMGKEHSQIFKYDCQKGMETLVSQSPGQTEADADCTSPSISADGALVSFVSSAMNLCGGNGRRQVLVSRPARASLVLAIHRGWNFCALPFWADEASAALLNEAGTCWGWNGSSYVRMTRFPMGQGFWLYADEDKELSLTGETAEPVALLPGWNLVDATVFQNETSHKCIFSYNPVDNSYLRYDGVGRADEASWLFIQ